MNNIKLIIDRIRYMERLFDEALEAFSKGHASDEEKLEIYRKLEILADYYHNGLWLSDYECDERGELPSDLKRGVLSEDGLYNLLDDMLWNSDNVYETEETEDII